jgi:hypothetical protein
MNVNIGAEAAQFPEKEYINGISVAVLMPVFLRLQYLNTAEKNFPFVVVRPNEVRLLKEIFACEKKIVIK